MRHFRVYIARDSYQAEPTTLTREAEARRYGVADIRDANLVVEARDEREARRIRRLRFKGACVMPDVPGQSWDVENPDIAYGDGLLVIYPN
jgi:hypothetical protein